jgi:hypothetical protein
VHHKRLNGTCGSLLQVALVNILQILQCLVRSTLKFYIQIIKQPLNKNLKNRQLPRRKYRFNIADHKKALKSRETVPLNQINLKKV